MDNPASNEKGLATKVGRYLSNAGLSINRTGNFSVEVSKNTIYIKDSNKYEKTTEYLKKIFVDADFKYESPEKLSTADILILVKTFK
jgi:ribulose-5-phosphate 4-epimerase/fuculose-1-phosphate aldolase